MVNNPVHGPQYALGGNHAKRLGFRAENWEADPLLFAPWTGREGDEEDGEDPSKRYGEWPLPPIGFHGPLHLLLQQDGPFGLLSRYDLLNDESYGFHTGYEPAEDQIFMPPGYPYRQMVEAAHVTPLDELDLDVRLRVKQSGWVSLSLFIDGGL